MFRKQWGAVYDWEQSHLWNVLLKTRTQQLVIINSKPNVDKVNAVVNSPLRHNNTFNVYVWVMLKTKKEGSANNPQQNLS